jgi:uncharacterized membrane protein
MLRLLKKQNFSLWDYLAFISVFIFILAGALVSINRFWQYETFYYDFGIFDQAIWSASRFKAPIIEHFVVGGKWIFADHFNPSLFILSPLYWLTDKQEIILIAQSVAAGLAGLVIYLIGKEVLKNKLYSFSISTCYLLFVGLQNAVITDIHEITFATLFLALTFYFFIKKKYKFFLLLFLITLGFKESNFILGIGIGLAVFLIDRTRWKLASLVIAISIIWGMVSINYIIPYFSGGFFQYETHLSNNPIQIAKTFIDSPVKINTMHLSFLSFGYLPVLGFQFWPAMLQDFLVRFYSPLWVTRWGLGFHYSALTAVIMGIASIYGFRLLDRIIKKKMILKLLAVILILNAVYLYQFKLRGPFALAYNRAFYAHSNDFEFLDKMVEIVPDDAFVMTSNNLATRFTHQKVMLLRDKCKTCNDEHYQTLEQQPDYILRDSRPGQNPNNHYGAKIDDILEALKKDKNYKAVYQTDYQYVFKKI